MNIFVAIAQLGERKTEDLKVTGSIPVFDNWSYSVMVITRGFDSRDLGSIPSKTYNIYNKMN